MAHFVIVGILKCEQTAHAIHAAKYLSKHLTNFTFTSIEKTEEEWQIWLIETNLDNSWHHTGSPIIWKEINHRGCMKHLIGGLGEFWEYCYDYYGFESKLSKDDVSRIMADNAFIASFQEDKPLKIISVYGANNHPFLELLFLEIAKYLESNAYVIKLFDNNIDTDDPDSLEDYLESAEELAFLLDLNANKVSIVSSTEELLEKCELLFLINDYSQQPNETLDSWLHNCKQEMIILAQDINRYAVPNLRVVLTNHGPICFNATILVQYCTRIRLQNIVAVTADEGFSTLSILAEKADTPIRDFNCPPVWGFCGIKSYVSLSETVLRAEVYRPSKRAATARKGSQLPQGTIEVELRFLGNVLATDKPLYTEIEERKKKQQKILGRLPILAKIKATGSLIKLWYAEKISDDIISLGVCSNGSFGLPAKVVLSQLVFLNDRRIWEPFSEMIVAPETLDKLGDMLSELSDLFKTF